MANVVDLSTLKKNDTQQPEPEPEIADEELDELAAMGDPEDLRERVVTAFVSFQTVTGEWVITSDLSKAEEIRPDREATVDDIYAGAANAQKDLIIQSTVVGLMGGMAQQAQQMQQQMQHAQMMRNLQNGGIR